MDATDDESLYIGIEIGGTKLQLVSGDSTGTITRRWRAHVNKLLGGPGICRQIQTGLNELTQFRRPTGVGVGFGGPIDIRTGQVCTSHQIDGWDEFPLRDWVSQQAMGAPCVVDNDANTGALGEAIRGAGVGLDPVFYVTLGSGVGGGLVANGRVYHGAAPGEAEFGHVRLDREGTIVEHRCSGWAVDRRIQELQPAHPDSELVKRSVGMDGGEAKHLAGAIAAGDPVAEELLLEIADDLGFALSHVTHLFHPSVIVLGGGLSLVGEPLRAAVANALHRFIMEAFAPGPEVRLAALGEDAVPVGALQLALRAAEEIGRTKRIDEMNKASAGVKDWIAGYVEAQKKALDSIPVDGMSKLIERFRVALAEDRQIFVFGNGGSAANASHFVTDLGKGASDKLNKRFRCSSLNDNVSWMSALGNDYSYEEVFSRQLHNFARPGDIVLMMSVSGSSPNLIKAADWCKQNGIHTIALIGGKRGKLATIADEVLVIDSVHYGRVEDAHMAICHMLCYVFMEVEEEKIKTAK